MKKNDISVIIPTFNRIELLTKVLFLYNQQTYPIEKIEVIVVDDDSTDGTEEQIRELKTKVGYELHYIKQKKGGPASAKNKGIKIAKGDILLFANDDVLPEKNLLEQHVKTLEQYPESAVLGFVEWSEDFKVTDFMRYVAPNGYMFRYNTIKDVADCGFRHFFTCNISIGKKWFSDELFDEDFPFPALEDIETGYRLEKKGLRVVFNKNALGHHCHPITLESFRHRMRLVGISAVFFLKKHPELRHIFLPVRLEIVRVISLFLRLLTVFEKINKKIYWWSIIVISYIEGLQEGSKT